MNVKAAVETLVYELEPGSILSIDSALVRLKEAHGTEFVRSTTGHLLFRASERGDLVRVGAGVYRKLQSDVQAAPAPLFEAPAGNDYSEANTVRELERRLEAAEKRADEAEARARRLQAEPERRPPVEPEPVPSMEVRDERLVVHRVELLLSDATIRAIWAWVRFLKGNGGGRGTER